MSVISENEKDPLRCMFDAAVASGELCRYCGGALSLPCIRVHLKYEAAPMYFHPACSIDLIVRLGADVKEVQQITGSHAALRRESSPRRPHPEVE